MENLLLDCHTVSLAGINVSPVSVPLTQNYRPTFDDMGFSENVDILIHTLKYTLKKEPLQECKDSIILLLLQALEKSSEKLPKNASMICESWMQSKIPLLSCAQDILSTFLSIDVCVAVISRFGCEKRFMQVLLEEKEFEVIEDLGESLGRWICIDKSVIFVTKILEVLLKTYEISAEVVQKYENFFLAKLHLILKQMPQQQSFLVFKRLRRMYIAEFCRESLSTWHFDTEPIVLLKSAFELIRYEIDNSSLTDFGNGKANLLKRIINVNLDQLSLIQRSRMPEVFGFVCQDNGGISEFVVLDHERIEVFGCGIVFLESIAAEFQSKVCCDYEQSKKTDVDILWTQIVNLVASKKSARLSEMHLALLHVHSLQVMIQCHKFMELLDTIDTPTLVIVENLPQMVDLFSPVICNVDFLIKMFKEIADLHTDAALDTEKQDIFDALLCFAYRISKNAEVKVIKTVMHSCLDAFSCEKLNFFASTWHKEKFLQQLNLAINQLSENNSDNFHELAHLSLLCPFGTLHELMRRGCSSAPLSKLILEFFDQMTPLLLLQRGKFQKKEIITIIENNLQTIEKEKCQVMADFINKVMEIKHVNGSKTAVNPYDVLSHVVIPGLEKNKVKCTEGTAMSLLLLILKSVLSLIKEDVKGNARKYTNEILTSAFYMIEILANYEAQALNSLCTLQNERQELHLSILSALETVKSFLLDQNTMGTVYNRILTTLPDMKWHHKFYFFDLLYCKPDLINFPIPSPIYTFSANYGSLQFHGVADFSTDNSPYYLWVLVFEVCKINMTIAQHFMEMILRISSPKILDIVTAVSQSLLESTNHGWQSVVSLIHEICQTRSAKMLRELHPVGLESMPRMVKCFFYKISIITHSFLIALRSFVVKDEQTLSITTQKIEGSFINSMQELKDSDKSDALNCFVILYKFASLLQQHLSNTSEILDSVILQILETMSKKEQTTLISAEIGQWSQRHMDFKKYLVSVNRT